MKITYWSDYACPYCYIGEARLHRAIREMELEDQVEFEPKAFQLDPGAPDEPASDTLTRFVRKYGLPIGQARLQLEKIEAAGKAEGIDFRYFDTKFTNTFNAHRLMKLALSKGDPLLAQKTNTLLFDAYFTKNLMLASPAVLLAVGEEAGLAREEVEALLASDQFAAQVRQDEREAAELNIHGVPYFIFPGGFSIPGAVSVRDFKDALSYGVKNASRKKAHQCGPDGCQI